MPTKEDQKMYQLVQQLSELDMQSWLQHDVFSTGWWILVATFIIPWLIFLKLSDKRRLPELLLLGSWIISIAETLDHLGYELGLWYYPMELMPLFPRFEEVNLSVLPVCYMLIYQYYPDWKRYTIALTIMSALFTGLAEPALIYLDLYHLVGWKAYYGFPIYIAIGLAVKWAVQKIYTIAAENVFKSAQKERGK